MSGKYVFFKGHLLWRCPLETLRSEVLRTKSKPSGLPDNNVIFFVATKKTKQKKAWLLCMFCSECFWWQVRLSESFRYLHFPR